VPPVFSSKQTNSFCLFVNWQFFDKDLKKKQQQQRGFAALFSRARNFKNVVVVALLNIKAYYGCPAWLYKANTAKFFIP